MLKTKFAKVVCSLSLVAVAATGLVSCSGGSSSGANDSQVAATINDKKITEGQVTSKVDALRTKYGLSSDDAWGSWLARFNMTPESVREEMINSFAEGDLIAAGAKEMGLEVEESEIDSYVSKMKEKYSTDEAWSAALEKAGFSESEYRETIRTSLLKSKVQSKLSEDVQVTDEERLEYAKKYSSFLNGAKRSSHVLIATDDKETAEDVLARIKAGTLTIEDAAKEYSKDTGSAAKGGDVGWDKLNQFVKEYTEALKELDKGQVSELVTSQYGFHIIKCTDVWEAPEELTSTDQMPKDIVDAITRMGTTTKTNEKFTAWLKKQREASNLDIKPMPEGLSYSIDVEKYKKPAAESPEKKPESEQESSAEGSASKSESSESDSSESK
ncbi:peptidylprolyl isomerase [Eggerthellaceae bacterium zg-1084]|uniref:Peptidylprolyl isomerase n=1 Tax=Berryella wangjianweii TaxID=2734634 RepID=A0A6M8J367_9ACTN|nr:peptidylprolyl isomerase [Berryella wangjianweii]NPD30949.1 peptidylprolyl isomerase [Berryella wangjianweii]NPD31814.1 peptidylprolyl isomerase [Eggerthellaceae bacterium zg-997]QKF07591.1 peptidylprolyl isomerase [Berryella wangjianweii]